MHQAKQRMFVGLEYAADSWPRQRRVVGRLEHVDEKRVNGNPTFP